MGAVAHGYAKPHLFVMISIYVNNWGLRPGQGKYTCSVDVLGRSE